MHTSDKRQRKIDHVQGKGNSVNIISFCQQLLPGLMWHTGVCSLQYFMENQMLCSILSGKEMSQHQSYALMPTSCISCICICLPSPQPPPPQNVLQPEELEHKNPLTFTISSHRTSLTIPSKELLLTESFHHKMSVKLGNIQCSLSTCDAMSVT